MGSPDRRRWIAFLTACGITFGGGGVVWAALLMFQIGHAWGFRGMPKPGWFDWLTLAVYGGPLVAAVLLPLVLVVGIYLLSRAAPEG